MRRGKTSRNEKEEQEKGSRVNKINATKKKLIFKKKERLEDVFKCPSHKGKDSKDLYPNDLTPNPVLTQGNRKDSMIILG